MKFCMFIPSNKRKVGVTQNYAHISTASAEGSCDEIVSSACQTYLSQMDITTVKGKH